MDIERLKNEYLMARLQEEKTSHVPLITIAGTTITSIIIVAWALFLF